MAHESNASALKSQLERNAFPSKHSAADRYEVTDPKPHTLAATFMRLGVSGKAGAAEPSSTPPPLPSGLNDSLHSSLSLPPPPPRLSTQSAPHHLVYPSTRKQFDFFHRGDEGGNEQEKHVLYDLLNKNDDLSYRSVAISSHVWYDLKAGSVKENDIVVVNDVGILILEIKGLSTKSNQVVSHIGKALQQGAAAVSLLNNSLYEFINNSEQNKREWGQLNSQPVPIYYAAVLPKVDVTQLPANDQHQLKIHLQADPLSSLSCYHFASHSECTSPKKFSLWLRSAVFRDHTPAWSSSRWSVLQQWAEVMLCRTRLIMKSLIDDHWEAMELRLTAHQASLSQSEDRETLIRGYAGTGKTIIALAKVKNRFLCVSNGKHPHQVFFFTSQPAFHAEECFRYPNVHFFSTQQLRTSREECLRNICSAIQKGRAAHQRQHIIVDEFQNWYSGKQWMCLRQVWTLLDVDEEDNTITILMDDNQRHVRQLEEQKEASDWIKHIPVTHLYVVLRNTRRVAEQALRFYDSKIRPTPSLVDSIPGVGVDFVTLNTPSELKREWKSERLRGDEAVMEEPDSSLPRRSTRHRSECKEQQAKRRQDEVLLEEEWIDSGLSHVRAHIGGEILGQLRELKAKGFKSSDVAVLFLDDNGPQDMSAFVKWGEANVNTVKAKEYRGRHLVADTVRAFAGLDRKVIILVHPYCGDPVLSSAKHWMYIGCSRAVTKLIVLADREAVRIMKGHSGAITELYAPGTEKSKRERQR